MSDLKLMLNYIILFAFVVYFLYILANLDDNRNEGVSIFEASRLAAQNEYQKEEGNIMSRIKELFQLGLDDAESLLSVLRDVDPLGINHGPTSFVCPTSRAAKVDSDDSYDYDSLVKFREEEKNTWLFYQNMRQSRGEEFCELANANMPRRSVPMFYCMPDFRGGLATPPWDDPQYLVKTLRKNKFRIAFNEYDAISDEILRFEDVVYSTTLRHPVDRWYLLLINAMYSFPNYLQ